MNALPEQFRAYDTSTQIKIVQLGLYCWNAVQAEIETHNELNQDELIRVWKNVGRKEGAREKEKEMDRIFKEKQDAFDDLSSEYNLLKKRMDKAEKQFSERLEKEIQQQKEYLTREAKLKFAEEMSNLKEENMRLKNSADFKNAYEFLQQKYLEKSAEADSLKTAIDDLKKVKSSFALGKQGEGEIEEYLRQLSEFDYENVHAEADKADFRLTNKEKKMVVLDSKNFSHAVPKRDRDKLVNNVNADASVCGGLMVSLNSKISARNHCEIEFTASNKPILYLCLANMSNDARLHTIDVGLKMLFKIVDSDSEHRTDIIDKIRKACVEIEGLRLKLENIKKAAAETIENAKLGLLDVKKLGELLSS